MALNAFQIIYYFAINQETSNNNKFTLILSNLRQLSINIRWHCTLSGINICKLHGEFTFRHKLKIAINLATENSSLAWRCQLNAP